MSKENTIVAEEGYEDRKPQKTRPLENDSVKTTTERIADDSVPVTIGRNAESKSFLDKLKGVKDRLPASKGELIDTAVGAKKTLNEAAKSTVETSGSAMEYLKRVGSEFNFSKLEIVKIAGMFLFSGGTAALIPLLQKHGPEFAKMLETISNDAKNRSPVAIALLENIKKQLDQTSGNPIVKKFIDNHGGEITAALKQKASETKNAEKAFGIVQKTADNRIIKKGLIPIAKQLLGKKK